MVEANDMGFDEAKASMLHEDIEFVLRTVEERDVHFIQFWFTDTLGNLKSFAATSGELDDALEEGLGFDGSSVAGFSPVEESDCVPFQPVALLPLPVLHKMGTSVLFFSKLASRLIACMKL